MKEKKKYYYYKKKVGRHKKPGPKKKPKKRGRKWQEPWDFKILKFTFKKQKSYIGVFHDEKEVEYAKSLLIKENESVVFPKKYTNNGRKNKSIYENDCEYVILKRIRNSETEPTTTLLRNQYGKFVENRTTSKNWAVYDKFPCLEEETFWVYGHNPKTDRKTATWIIDNMITKYSEEKNNIVIVYLLNNKVIFKYEEDISFVICKNISDAIRLYNFIEEKTKKTKNAIMTGATTNKDPRGKETINIICEKTGWDKKKISRTSTRA